MPDETPNNPTPQTQTATPQGAPPAVAPSTQTGNLSDRIAAMAFPEGKPLPFTAKQAEEVDKKQSEAAKVQTPAAPATTPQADDDTPPAELSEKGKASWRIWKDGEKKKYSELETKYKALNSEVETYKKNPQTKVEIKAPNDYEDIKKREAEYSDRLKLLDLQNHPQFKQHFETKYSAVFDTVKMLGGKDGDKLVDLLKQPESDLRTQRLEEVFATISPLYQSQLGAALLEYKKVEAEKSNELAKGKENYAKFINMQQENQRKLQEQAQAKMDAEFEKQLQAARKDLPIFQKKDGDDTWNRQVDSFEKQARDIYTGNLPLPDLARASQWSAAAPLFLQDLNAKAEEIKNLNAEINRLKGAQPKPGAGVDPKENEVPSNLSLSERIVWQAQRAGAVR